MNDDQVSVSEVVYDSERSQLPSAIYSIMEIQESHFLIEKSNPGKSFLITKWNITEWTALLSRGAKLFILKDGANQALGYLLCASAEEFLSQLAGTEHTFELSKISGNPSEWTYLYQMAIGQSYQGRGFGDRLLRFVKQHYHGQKFVSDYMIQPFVNQDSEKLLLRNGFQKSGVLKLPNYRGFQPSEWQIVT